MNDHSESHVFGGLGFQDVPETDSTCCPLVQAATPAFRISKGPQWCGGPKALYLPRDRLIWDLEQFLEKESWNHFGRSWEELERITQQLHCLFPKTCDVSIHRPSIVHQCLRPELKPGRLADHAVETAERAAPVPREAPGFFAKGSCLPPNIWEIWLNMWL